MESLHDRALIYFATSGRYLSSQVNHCKVLSAFTENFKDLLQKIRENMVGGSSIEFTRKAVVEETLVRDLTNWCENIVGIDASQHYPSSLCQAMPTGLYSSWGINSECGQFKPRQNKARIFENIVMSYIQRVRPQCIVESFYKICTQKNWCIYSWWLLRTLQHCVRNNGVLLSLLSRSRSSSFSRWRSKLARHWKKRARQTTKTMHTRKVLQRPWELGRWFVDHVQKKYW